MEETAKKRKPKKNKGKPFEDAVKKSFLRVDGVSIDRLKDASITRRNNGELKKLKGADNPSDFIVYKYPHEIYVECKSHKGNTLPFSCIREEQIYGMFEKAKIYGVKAGVIVWYIDHDMTAWFPIDHIVKLKEEGVKSIHYSECLADEAILIKGKKKRVYFDYDMDKFLEDLYEQVGTDSIK